MSDVLDRIVARKRQDLAVWREQVSLDQLDRQARTLPPPRGFAAALRRATEAGFGLIAEIKKASPSHGLIRPAFDPAALAQDYEKAGAACLSVLTDGPYFHGSNDDLQAARTAVKLPVLRKDFIVDPWQVAEARAIGADCILLIMAVLTAAEAGDLVRAARERGLDVLAEAHDRAELDQALGLDIELIGINNRDLKTLSTRLETSLDLGALIPKHCLGVSESGIASNADLKRLAGAGFRAFLVGEALLRQHDVVQATRLLLAGE